MSRDETHRIEMLKSPALRAAGLSARRGLDRIEIEHADHPGDNGELKVTYADFERHGVRYNAIAPMLAELEALGLTEIMERGTAGNADDRTPTLYRLTYLPTANGPATDDWKRFNTVGDEDDKTAMRRAKLAAKRATRHWREIERRWRIRRKHTGHFSDPDSGAGDQKLSDPDSGAITPIRGLHTRRSKKTVKKTLAALDTGEEVSPSKPNGTDRVSHPTSAGLDGRREENKQRKRAELLARLDRLSHQRSSAKAGLEIQRTIQALNIGPNEPEELREHVQELWTLSENWLELRS